MKAVHVLLLAILAAAACLAVADRAVHLAESDEVLDLPGRKMLQNPTAQAPKKTSGTSKTAAKHVAASTNPKDKPKRALLHTPGRGNEYVVKPSVASLQPVQPKPAGTGKVQEKTTPNNQQTGGRHLLQAQPQTKTTNTAAVPKSKQPVANSKTTTRPLATQTAVKTNRRHLLQNPTTAAPKKTSGTSKTANKPVAAATPMKDKPKRALLHTPGRGNEYVVKPSVASLQPVQPKPAGTGKVQEKAAPNNQAPGGRHLL